MKIQCIDDQYIVFYIVVGATGFEPATACSQNRSATGLRYTPLLSIMKTFISELRVQRYCFLFIPQNISIFFLISRFFSNDF